MSDPLISIIVPVYLVEQYLDECVKSILSQTYKNFELILIDDGSNDNCAGMCDCWSKKDVRVNVIHKDNGGVSAARNTGIDVACGKYITFVDSDDYILPIMLERLVRYITDDRVDAVITESYYSFCDILSFADNDDFCEIDYFCVDAPNALINIYSKTFRWEIWGNLYKAELFRNNRFIDGMVYAEDFDLVLRLLLEANNILFTNEKLYCYRLRSGSAMHSLKKSVPSNLYFSAKRNIEVVRNTQFQQKDKDNIVAGILLEVSSRVDDIQNEALMYLDRKNYSFMRQLLRSNLFCILKAVNISCKNKIYMFFVAFSLIRFYKLISYKYRSANCMGESCNGR